MKGDGVYWEKAGWGCQIRTTSSLVYVSEASKTIRGEFKRDEKWPHILRTQRVVTGRVRLLPLVRTIAYWLTDIYCSRSGETC